MGSHAGALIVIHKSKLLKVGWVGTKWKPTILADRWEVETHHFGGSVGSGNPPFWRIGGFPLRSYPPYKKNHLNQILKYLCITMSAVASEPEKNCLNQDWQNDKVFRIGSIL